uniref:Out at first protein homolog n=1 Tax=Salmo trutta TaxID=8032 RepID=A0A674D087_SALTR
TYMPTVHLLVAPVLISLLVVNHFGSLVICSELKVRVRLSDGQIAEEILVADSEKDSITVEFKQGDGTHITAVFDFKRDVRIVRALILGEPERGQNQYQVLCFISRLNHHQIIHTESMARHRQVRQRRGVEHIHMDMVVNMSRAGHLNTLIHNVCKEAHGGFYTRTGDTNHWLDEGIEAIEFEPLYCLRLGWLPCLLKYCRSRLGVAGRANPYMCGIRSCSKGYRFDYYVPHRQLYPWDEET